MSYIKEDLLLVAFMLVNNYMNINQEYLEMREFIMILIIWLVLLDGVLMNKVNRSFGMLGTVGEPIGGRMGSLELSEVRIIYL